jgi:hypothetical protein
MRHVLIAFMLVMSISSDGFANETQLHWTYLKYDGSTASATLKIDTVRRPQRFTLVLSDFNKSVEVYSVAYSVVSRLKIPEELGIAAGWVAIALAAREAWKQHKQARRSS